MAAGRMASGEECLWDEPSLEERVSFRPKEREL
jgi:hypothetical protein